MMNTSIKRVSRDCVEDIINRGIIIHQFKTNVKGKKFIKSGRKNDGEEGHWLEQLMGIIRNNNNAPDKLGYEQKKQSKKTTFGDWSASNYLYKNIDITRDEFIKTVGSPNPKKNNRYSWSGKVFPTYGQNYNYAGQRIIFLDNGDLVIQYLHSKDTREEKTSFIEEFKSNDQITLAIWKKQKLEKCVNDKFNVKGFYICKKNKDDIYEKICFGKTIDFIFLKNGLEQGNIFLDSGMYQGNARQYSSFRANENVWNKLITEEY